MGRSRKISKTQSKFARKLKQKFRCLDGICNKNKPSQKDKYDDVFDLSSVFKPNRIRRDHENVYNLTSLFEPISFIKQSEHFSIPGLTINYTNLDINDELFISKVINSLKTIIQSEIAKHKSIKIFIRFVAIFHDKDGNPITTYQNRKAFAMNKHIIKNMDLNEIFNEMMNDILEIEKGESGLTFQYLNEIVVETYKNQVLKRGSKFIRTPECIIKSRAILNIENKDEFCFLYCMAAADHPVNVKDHPERASKYTQYLKDYNTQNITFPISIDDIKVFEELNQKSINVFTLEEELNESTNESSITSFENLYISKFDFPQKIELLLLQDSQINEIDIQNESKLTDKQLKTNYSHYTLIKDFEKLVYGRIPNTIGHPRKIDDPLYFKYACRKCLTCFTDKVKFDKHDTYCKFDNSKKNTQIQDLY